MDCGSWRRRTLGLYEMGTRPTTTFSLLNVANEGSPLQDVGVRRAVAQAIDQDFRNQSLAPGCSTVANGPFRPGEVGYLQDTGFPEYDPDAAAEFVEGYEAEHGPIVIRYRATADPATAHSPSSPSRSWRRSGSRSRSTRPSRASTSSRPRWATSTWSAGGAAAAIDPAATRGGWHSESSAPIGEIALNFGRFEDDVIDANLDVMRSSADEEERREAAEAINRASASRSTTSGSDWVFWAILTSPTSTACRPRSCSPTAPTASSTAPAAWASSRLSQLWVEG